MRSKPAAVFMAFGTKGDIYPLAAIAAAFACDQEQYQVVFITHSAHENLMVQLRANKVTYIPVSSPPVVSPLEHYVLHVDQVRWSYLFLPTKGKLSRNIGMSVLRLLRISLEIAQWKAMLLLLISSLCAPSSFERQFRKEHPGLYNHLQEAPTDKVGWKDVIHWMWPLFTEEWGSWRSLDLNLSSLPFTDPVTGLPTFHERLPSPLLLYGFSKEVVEYPGYWPSKVRVCGFWFPPKEWQFSCNDCAEISASVSSGSSNKQNELCSIHLSLQFFIEFPATELPIFIGLSSIGSMGFLRNPHAFLRVLGTALDISGSRFILFTAGYEPLEAAIDSYAKEASSCPEQTQRSNEGVSLFGGRLFCFSGSVPYNWLFPRCAAAIHHGGSGSTAAALLAGVPQVICPFMLDQFYWAERMYWLGVAPEPLKREHLVPDKDEDFYIKEAANMLVRALDYSQSSEVKSRALQISNKLSNEDGVSEAVHLINEELRSCR
ncbi:sterol 3-beta-glucosyltransferase UGT80B1 isoform X2 [Solanum stenotomum]|uniref:sterol 3-beta-glucosyltransferase UGT80B1 isoform X2 n=1 Tax=Solanum stenotomum TaxID=172797 RepID=UPI0020D1F1FB|nr:sterol 3-beta-glucosyltransferase UGT80B1 isoform X2 [Solanum stenotomum]